MKILHLQMNACPIALKPDELAIATFHTYRQDLTCYLSTILQNLPII
jgi:hypothetical protein